MEVFKRYAYYTLMRQAIRRQHLPNFKCPHYIFRGPPQFDHATTPTDPSQRLLNFRQTIINLLHSPTASINMLPLHTRPIRKLQQLPISSIHPHRLQLHIHTNATLIQYLRNLNLVTTPTSLSKYVRMYMELGKARLSSLVVLSSSAGFLMAGGPVSWTSFACCSIGTALAAASANTFNQVIETQLDRKMMRTCKRVLPEKRMTHTHALAFGATSAMTSSLILGLGCNATVATLGLFNIGLYSLVYTPMKTKTEFNTYVGSIVGAIPPVMGWAAATGSMYAPEAALQAALLFCWQMPHFYALSWRLKKDYARGGFKMVPCADPTGERTGKLIVRYALCLCPIPVIATMTDITSSMFAVEGCAVNAYAVYLAYQFRKNPNNSTAQRVFLCSLWYLPVLLGCIVLHSQHWIKEMEIEKEANSPLAKNCSQDDVLHTAMTEKSALSTALVHVVYKIRRQLEKICIHEILWKRDEKHPKGDETRVICPVFVKNSAKEIAELVNVQNESNKDE